MIKIYCDTSNLKQISDSIKRYNIDGVTTNPSIMKNEGVKSWHIEGYEHLDWVLIDFVHIVVHIFSKETRKYYECFY